MDKWKWSSFFDILVNSKLNNIAHEILLDTENEGIYYNAGYVFGELKNEKIAELFQNGNLSLKEMWIRLWY